MKPFFFCSVLLTLFLNHCFISVTLFCSSGDVFVEDCVLQFQKAEKFD